jgi:hypothetical protein
MGGKAKGTTRLPHGDGRPRARYCTGVPFVKLWRFLPRARAPPARFAVRMAVRTAVRMAV